MFTHANWFTRNCPTDKCRPEVHNQVTFMNKQKQEFIRHKAFDIKMNVQLKVMTVFTYTNDYEKTVFIIPTRLRKLL